MLPPDYVKVKVNAYNSHATGLTTTGTHVPSRSVTCHPADVTFSPLPQPIKAGSQVSDQGGMQGWVDLVGLVTYRGGVPAQRRSLIPVLTGLNYYSDTIAKTLHGHFTRNVSMVEEAEMVQEGVG